MKNEKTHILWNPNKNYLGNWDLPTDGKDLTLTIRKMEWAGVENYNKPIKENGRVTGYEEDSKRVITFEEDYKPLICNEENAEAILKAHGIEAIEDYGGIKITLYKHRGKFFGDIMDVVRVRDVKPVEKKKMTLTADHEKWAGIVEKIKKEDLEPEYFETWFEISPAVKNQLLNAKNK